MTLVSYPSLGLRGEIRAAILASTSILSSTDTLWSMTDQSIFDIMDYVTSSVEVSVNLAGADAKIQRQRTAA